MLLTFPLLLRHGHAGDRVLLTCTPLVDQPELEIGDVPGPVSDSAEPRTRRVKDHRGSRGVGSDFNPPARPG